MSAMTERGIDLSSVQGAWRNLNKLVRVGRIINERDYKHRVRVLEYLLDEIGADESHPLAALLDLVAQQIEVYESEHHSLPDAAPAEVLRYLMEENGLRQTDLSHEVGGQSIVSAILNGKRELNARQVKALAKRFKVSPAVFL
jgi:HTH-type transcriptional regulator/antitoxin HigA